VHPGLKLTGHKKEKKKCCLLHNKPKNGVQTGNKSTDPKEKGKEKHWRIAQ
jgi:hypothetical protein